MTVKLLAVFALLGVGYVVFLNGPAIVAAIGAVGATLLIQLIINYLKPKTPQEETMQNLGFTGLSLGGTRSEKKDAEDSARP